MRDAGGAMTFTEESARLERWAAMAAGIRVGGPLPITFTLLSSGPRFEHYLQASMLTEPVPGSIPDYNPDRDGTQVTMRIPLPSGEPGRELFLQMAQQLYRHECAEWISHDGVRFADPHAGYTLTVKL